jgi:hypothetical protein
MRRAMRYIHVMRSTHSLRRGLGLLGAGLLLLVLLSAAVAAFPGPGVRLFYRETTGNRTLEREYQVRTTDQGFDVTLLEDGLTRTLILDSRMYTLREGYSDAAGGKLDLVRQGQVMRLSGRLGSREVARDFPVDDVAWYGSVLCLRDFVLQGRQSQEFYVTKPEEDRVLKLVAEREGVERVLVGGQDMDTVRVKFTLPDLRRLLWSSTYWFRASDGLFVKSEEQRGPPGTAKSRVELMEERQG